MRITDLKESLLRRHFEPEILKRGNEYQRQGMVQEVIYRDNTLTARVQGSDYEPYQVTVILGKRDIESADCSCPYGEEWNGWCKHIAAVLLYCVHSPELVEKASPLTAVLSALDRHGLQNLILRFAEARPDLVNEISRIAESLPSNGKPASKKTPSASTPLPPDADALRHGVRRILSSTSYGYGSDSYWQAATAAHEMSELLGPLRRRLENGDAGGAMIGLEAITAEYIHRWFETDDSDGDLGSVCVDIGALWCEAFLMTEPLSATEQSAWRRKIKGWRDEAAEYGAEDGFDVALEALQEGWDDPTLVRILKGDAISPRISPERPEWALPAPDIADIRLNVLERQGRREEALRLARWARKPVRVAHLLIDLGRGGAVEKETIPLLSRTTEALAVARLLDQAEEVPDDLAIRQSLRIAKRGLDLPGPRHELALWTRDAALEDDLPLTRRAAEEVIRSVPALPDWQRLSELTPAHEWPALRDEIIEDIVHDRQRLYGEGLAGAVDILLHENRIREAMHVTENTKEDMAGRVADKAAPLYPNEILTLARKRAEPIMNEGKSGGYEEAARWLSRARTAYRTQNRESEWQTYLDQLLTTHRRKYRLMPLLQALQK